MHTIANEYYAEENHLFKNFVRASGPEHTEFIESLNSFILQDDGEAEIKESKSGYLVSYLHRPSGRTAANYVFRKKGPMLSIYADNISTYPDLLSEWPASMKAGVLKASPRKRLPDPNSCHDRCLIGFDFIMNSEGQCKCRFNGFQFFLPAETKAHLK